MEPTIWPAAVASASAAVATTAGILTIRRAENWALANAPYFVVFAAGVLVSISLLHIISKALVLSSQAPSYLLAGYLVVHLFNRFATTFVCDRPTTAESAIGLVATAGIGLHSFIDGVIYSVTFSFGTVTGLSAAVGMVLHEFPEGVFTYVLLRKGGMAEERAFWTAIAAAALTTPAGTILSLPIIAVIDPPVLAALLALSAGALIYVGASHLLPMSEREPHPFSLVALGAGILVAIGIVTAH